jgi:cytochrome c oxidase subunit 4
VGDHVTRSVSPAAAHGHGHGAVGHLMPWTVLLWVFVALVVLTWLTVLAVQFDLGPGNLWIAMGIATVKAVLVCMYFMHMRYEKAFNILVVVLALLFVFLFISLALTDSAAYRPEIIWKQAVLNRD